MQKTLCTLCVQDPYGDLDDHLLANGADEGSVQTHREHILLAAQLDWPWKTKGIVIREAKNNRAPR